VAREGPSDLLAADHDLQHRLLGATDTPANSRVASEPRDASANIAELLVV